MNFQGYTQITNDAWKLVQEIYSFVMVRNIFKVSMTSEFKKIKLFCSNKFFYSGSIHNCTQNKVIIDFKGCPSTMKLTINICRMSHIKATTLSLYSVLFFLVSSVCSLLLLKRNLFCCSYKFAIQSYTVWWIITLPFLFLLFFVCAKLKPHGNM